MNILMIIILIFILGSLLLGLLNFLRKQDPIDLFTGMFVILSMFGIYRFYMYLREKNG